MYDIIILYITSIFLWEAKRADRGRNVADVRAVEGGRQARTETDQAAEGHNQHQDQNYHHQRRGGGISGDRYLIRNAAAGRAPGRTEGGGGRRGAAPKSVKPPSADARCPSVVPLSGVKDALKLGEQGGKGAFTLSLGDPERGGPFSGIFVHRPFTARR